MVMNVLLKFFPMTKSEKNPETDSRNDSGDSRDS